MLTQKEGIVMNYTFKVTKDLGGNIGGMQII